MPLETFDYIGNLNPANPTGSDDALQGDDHIRGIKQVLTNHFTAFTNTPVTATEAQLNAAASAVAAGTFSAADGTAAAPSIRFTDDTDTGFYRPAADSVGMAYGGVQKVLLDSAGFDLKS